MAKLVDPKYQAFYAAAEQVVDRVFREGDSLFTPGKPVWTEENLADLDRRYIVNFDEGEESFWPKLRRKLHGASAGVWQLAAELLYVHYLCVGNMTARGKRKRLHALLSEGAPGVTVPPVLDEALEAGIASFGQALTHIYWLIAFLLKAALLMRRMSAEARQELLQDASHFQQFLGGQPLDMKGSKAQREILLHIVHPEAFEPIASEDDKQAIVEKFATEVEDSIQDRDRKLASIRERLTSEYGPGFSFYQQPLRFLWNDDQKLRYWKIAPGDQAKDWPLCREQGLIYMNGDDFGDLSTMTHEQFVAKCDSIASAKGEESNVRKSNSFANLTWRFAKEIRIGDIVLANRGFSEVVGIGRVTGDYYFEPSQQVGGHRRKIDWYDVTPRSVDQPGWRSTLAAVKAEVAQAIIQGHPVPPELSATAVLCDYLARHPDATYEEVRTFADEQNIKIADSTLRNALYHYARAAIHAYRQLHSALPPVPPLPVPSFDGSEPPPLPLLLARKNVVLYGPPGTGKTHAAEQVISWWKIKHGPNSVRFVTFHPSFAYEDFVEGFRPDPEGRFVLQDGAFKRIADAARGDRAHDYLLVIDELNRGDVARIFGELITLIESSKRDRISAKLAYSKVPDFTVPANLYLLGTMNTADRSISLLDVAIRRRFAFVEVPPSTTVFGVNGFAADVGGVSLAKLLNGLNARLRDISIEADRAIGHSYLLIRDNQNEPLDELRRRVCHDLLPLVEEYCYAHRRQIRKVLGALVDLRGLPDLAVIEDDAQFVEALQLIAGGSGPTPAGRMGGRMPPATDRVEDGDVEDSAGRSEA